jgi:hypothetical protein
MILNSALDAASQSEDMIVPVECKRTSLHSDRWRIKPRWEESRLNDLLREVYDEE